MSPIYKNIALWLVIFLMLILLYHVISNPNSGVEPLTYDAFLDAVQNSEVESVTFRGGRIRGTYRPSAQKILPRFETNGPEETSESLIAMLREHDVTFSFESADPSPIWPILANWFPFLLFFGFFIFFMRQLQAGGGKAMSFGKSRARLMSDQQKKVTFEDVAGIDEAKEELEEIIAFLKDPHKFTRLGGRIPKGVLLMGAPGTGKTLLARAIAGEAGVPFFSISGSDFVEMFVGVGASRVRDLFVQGKKNAPCIIFIDEIDAVGRHRGAGLGGGHDEREQTLNQLLVEMDGFESSDGVILIASTNRPDVLDPALLRPGRFDRRVVVPRPDLKGREAIIRVHAKKTRVAPDVDFSVLARGTPGFCGADLENVVNEAALLAARENKEFIEMKDFERAKDKVLMGTERRSMVMSEEEKRITAFHEAGHTLVATLLENTDPIHKVSIIPRGMALGLTQQIPIDERHTYPREYLENRIAILMGGRVAEERIFGEITTGAGNDIEQATELARKMVCEWGMSEKLGPLTFGSQDHEIFLGREFAQRQNYSEHTAIAIDDEVKGIVLRNYEKAKRIIEENLEELERIAKALIEFEVLDGAEVKKLMKGEPIERPKEG